MSVERVPLLAATSSGDPPTFFHPPFPVPRLSVAVLRRRPSHSPPRRTIVVACLASSVVERNHSPPTAIARRRVALHSMRRPRELCFLTTFPFFDTLLSSTSLPSSALSESTWLVGACSRHRLLSGQSRT